MVWGGFRDSPGPSPVKKKSVSTVVSIISIWPQKFNGQQSIQINIQSIQRSGKFESYWKLVGMCNSGGLCVWSIWMDQGWALQARAYGIFS